MLVWQICHLWQSNMVWREREDIGACLCVEGNMLVFLLINNTQILWMSQISQIQTFTFHNHITTFKIQKHLMKAPSNGPHVNCTCTEIILHAKNQITQHIEIPSPIFYDDVTTRYSLEVVDL